MRDNLSSLFRQTAIEAANAAPFLTRAPEREASATLVRGALGCLALFAGVAYALTVSITPTARLPVALAPGSDGEARLVARLPPGLAGEIASPVTGVVRPAGGEPGGAGELVATFRRVEGAPGGATTYRSDPLPGAAAEALGAEPRAHLPLASRRLASLLGFGR